MKARPPLCSTAGKVPLIGRGAGGPDLWISGEGSTFIDRSGKSWLDFDLCLGTVVWGHARREVTDAVAEALKAGAAPTVPSAQEERAALTLLGRLPSYESVRFFKTGGDSCAAAVRLARLATGRDIVVSDGYHGWHDWGISAAYPDSAEALGVPATVRALNVRIDPADGERAITECLAEQGGRLAASVLRPEAWTPDVLGRLAKQIRDLGAILICDEVTSHFKYSRIGSAAALGVEPDMICISKGLANGMPLAALLGPAILLDRAASARISSTNSSETASLAAMIACEDLLSRASKWPVWRDSMASVVASLQRHIGQAGAESGFSIVHHPGFFSLGRHSVAFATDPFRHHVVETLARRSIYSRGWFHGSDAHAAGDWERLEQALLEAVRTWQQ